MGQNTKNGVVKQNGRIVFIDPNDLASLQGLSLPSKNSYDNFNWNNEELGISVDIQVFLPDRARCTENAQNFDSTISKINLNWGKSMFSSMFQGDMKVDENTNYLTTNFTDIGYTEIAGQNISSKEHLGVESIDVTFDAHFYPKVSLKLVDTRGSSLMMPEEEQEKGTRNYTNFFKSLFHFPNPRFLLSIKGYYGNRVTFMLAVNEFKTAFNATTGNFEITITFIGYLYGMYTDIPMNMLIVAPYIDGVGGELGAYWEGNGNFIFDDGSRIPTFMEFIDKYAHLAEELAKNESQNGALEDMTALSDQSGQLKTIQNNYDALIKEIRNAGSASIEVQGEKASVFFYENALDTSKFNQEAYTKLKESIATYNENATEGKLPDIADIGSGVKLIDNCVDEDIHSKSTISFVSNLDATLKKNIESMSKSVSKIKKKKCFIFNHNGLKDQITKQNKTITEAEKAKEPELAEHISKEVSNQMGFKPTIENIYRMIFAHIDCFTHHLYGVIEEVKGSNRKISDFNMSIKETDMPKSMTNNAFLPPFPAIFKLEANDNNNPRTLIYPNDDEQGRFSEFPEIILVEKFANAIFAVRKKADDLQEYIDTLMSRQNQNANGEEGGFEMKFVPTMASDYFFYGENPYAFINVNQASNGIKELLYYVYTRLRASSLSLSSKVSLNLNEIAKIEAQNFIKQNDSLNEDFKSQISGAVDKENVISKLLTDFDSENQSNIVARYSNAESEGFPIQFKSNKKSDKDMRFTNIRNATSKGQVKISDVFQVFEDRDFKNLKNFATAYGEITNADIASKFKETCTVLPDNQMLSLFEAYMYDYSHSQYEELHNIPEAFTPTTTTTSGTTSGSTETTSGTTSGTTTTVEVSDTSISSPYRKAVLQAMEDPSKVAIKSVKCLDENKKHVNLYSYLNSKGYKSKNSTQMNALCFLASLPVSIDCYTQFNAFIKGDSGSGWKAFPRCFVLLVGGLLYRMKKNLTPCGTDNNISNNIQYKYSSSNGAKSNILYFGSSEPNFSLKQIIDYNNINDEVIKGLVSYFEAWSNNEFNTIDTYLNTASNYENNSLDGLLTNEGAIKKLVEFYVSRSYVYIIHPSTVIQQNIKSIPISCVNVFLNELKNKYIEPKKEEKPKDSTSGSTTTSTTESSGDTTTDSTEIQSDATEDRGSGEDDGDVMDKNTKLAMYFSLKNLYDKWLCTYNKTRFQLNSPEVDKAQRIDHVSRSVYNINAKGSEYGSFLFVDSFYNDISQKMVISPKIVYDIVFRHLDANDNWSIYEFMANLAQENNMLFIALPVYNNFYTKEGMIEMFSPRSLYDGSGRDSLGLGSTYICMYTHEVAHNVDDEDDPNYTQYNYDGFNITDYKGNISDDAINLFEYNVDGGGDKFYVPTFAVSYGKQNQMYFKNITVNMDNPRTTDYSAANTLLLSRTNDAGMVNAINCVGQDLFSVYSHRSYNCTVEMMGCANITPMMYFQLNNVPMFKGAYFITNVSHHIQNNQMTTTFSGTKISKNALPYNTEVFNVKAFMDMIKTYGLGGPRQYGTASGGNCIKTETPVTTSTEAPATASFEGRGDLSGMWLVGDSYMSISCSFFKKHGAQGIVGHRKSNYDDLSGEDTVQGASTVKYAIGKAEQLGKKGVKDILVHTGTNGFMSMTAEKYRPLGEVGKKYGMTIWFITENRLGENYRIKDSFPHIKKMNDAARQIGAEYGWKIIEMEDAVVTYNHDTKEGLHPDNDGEHSWQQQVVDKIKSGGQYTPSTTAPTTSQVVCTPDGNTSLSNFNPQALDGCPISVNFVSFCVSAEGWTDGRNKPPYGTVGEDAMSCWGRDKAITVGPGLTQHVGIDTTPRLYTAQEIAQIYRTKVIGPDNSYVKTVNEALGNVKLGQIAYDALVDIAYNNGPGLIGTGNYGTKGPGLNVKETVKSDADVAKILRKKCTEYTGEYAKGWSNRRMAYVHLIEGTDTGENSKITSLIEAYKNPIPWAKMVFGIS